MSDADREDTPYYLYAMAMPVGGPIKIGYSADPDRRVRDFQRQGYESIFLFAKWPVGKMMGLAAERYAQWLLRDHHYRGEWFNVTREHAAEVIQIAGSAVLDRWNKIPPIDVQSRKIQHGEHIPVKHEMGTRDAIVAVLLEGECQTDFIRDAVAAEIKRRERAKP